MAKCFRHFKALMRKNAILWWRTPGCSAFEIIAPIILMAALWIIRLQVPTTEVDQVSMLKKQGISTIGLGPDPDTNLFDSSDDYLNGYVRNLTQFTGLCDDRGGCGVDYNIAEDYHGPKIYTPSHCIKSFDYDRPKQVSPYVAIIGTQTNITD